MKKRSSVLLFVMFTLLCVPILGVAQELTPEQIRQRLAEIQSRRETLERQGGPNPIENYERTLAGCDNPTGFQLTICSEAAYALARLYYDEAHDNFVAAQRRYEERFTRWERNPVGPRPTHPLPDYSKSLAMYKRAVTEYPRSSGLAMGYFQIGVIYSLDGEIEKSMQAFKDLIRLAPTSDLVAQAHFRLSEIYFMEHDLRNALKHLEAMDMSKVDHNVQEMATFRMADIHYSLGAFDISGELFVQYVDKVDRGEFPSGHLRPEAIEYISISFSNLPDGADFAIDFFRRAGRRTYQDTVIYAVGLKNYDHGQYRQAIRALQTAISQYPDFELAPKAQMTIVHAHVIEREEEKANAARETLVNTYGPNSQWVQRNRNNRRAVAEAEENVKAAIGAIGTYYHFLAQQAEERNETERARELYAKAVERYQQFIRSYPNDLWKLFEYNFYSGEAFAALGRYREAFTAYDYVASRDLSSYPEYTAEVDTLGLDDVTREEVRQSGNRGGANTLSQADAGYNAIAVLDQLRKQQVEPLPLSAREKFNHQLTQEFLNYIKAYQARFPEAERAADVLLLAASVAFDGEGYAFAIDACKQLIASYPGKRDLIWEATKLLGDAYRGDGQYDLAVSMYQRLLSENARPDERENLITLAAGSILLKAEHLKGIGRLQEATVVYRSIVDSYPNSEVAAAGWFDAAVAFESAGMYDSAAVVFEGYSKHFGKMSSRSDLLLRSYVLAGENYAKVNDHRSAARAYLGGARDQSLNDTAYSVKSYGGASAQYEAAEEFVRAAEVLVEAFRRFPMHEDAAKVLYSAGVLYEDSAEEYAKAIDVYREVAAKFPNTLEGLEAAFFIGHAYKKLEDFPAAARAFASFADNFTVDRNKQVEALLEATEIYQDLGNMAEAEKLVTIATKIYSEFSERASINPEVGAKAFYILGRLNHAKALRISLVRDNPRTVRANLNLKQGMVQEAIEAYMQSAALAIQEWTIKSLYALAELNVQYAEDFREMTVFGSEEERMVERVRILGGNMPVLYGNAMDELIQLITLARNQGISMPEIAKAQELFLEAGYRRGFLMKEVGFLFRDAPIPPGLDDEEQMIYADELYFRYLNYMAEAIPLYDQALEVALANRIPHSHWVDSILMEIELTEIETAGQIVSEFKGVDLDEAIREYEASDAAREEAIAAIQRAERDNLNRALAQIDRVYNNQDMEFEEKLTRLLAIRSDAERVIAEERRAIARLKQELGL